MKLKILLLLSLKVTFLFSQQTKYINTTNGLNIRIHPNTKSEKITKLKCGLEVLIIENTNVELTVKSEGKSITGNWVKIKSIEENIIGYAFNPFLTEKKPDIEYIVNIKGAKVYTAPTFLSKPFYTYPTGKGIIIAKRIRTKEKFIINKKFSLSGEWLKIRGVNGYVFSSDLSKNLPEMNKDRIMSFLCGKETGKRIKTRIEKFNDKEYEIEDEITEYENMTYTYTAFDGCFDHKYDYKKARLSEVYHQMIIDNAGVGELNGKKRIYYIPTFIKQKENEYFFEGEGATQDLKIIINKDGTYSVSSYDCT